MTKKFAIEAIAPSNIALIKYWGKADQASQWPSNDSVSMTLQNAHTRTIATPDNTTNATTLLWCGQKLDQSNPKIKKGLDHIAYLRSVLGFDEGLRINTRNSFPTGAGIASSASGMAALTLAAIATWTRSLTFDELAANGFERPRLAALARMGSGSAGRSIYGGYVHWRRGTSSLDQSITQCDDGSAMRLADIVVLVSSSEKATASTAGHRSAPESPLFGWRQALLPGRTARVLQLIADGNWRELGPIVESEALEMHAIMLTQPGGIQYFTDTTIQLFAHTAMIRQSTGLSCYATLDAGPNPHILCPASERDQVIRKIQESFPGFPLIIDETGAGPRLSPALDY